MIPGIAALFLAYVLSQFFRVCLAVLAPSLTEATGATPEDLAFASGLWFLVFALMQLPVGWGLDRIGPRRTAGVLLGAFGGAGALGLALAQSPLHITLAMCLNAIGCAPILMAGYTIFARSFPPARFATLAGAMLGFGTLGNILAAAPLALLVGALGWRATMGGIAVATLAIALLLLVLLRDPPPAPPPPAGQGSVFGLLRLPALWPVIAIMAVTVAPSSSLRGLWAGPYLQEVFGLTQEGIGWVTLSMGIASVLGSFAAGPLETLARSRKWVVMAANGGVCLACLMLWALPDRSVLLSAVLLTTVGVAGSAFALTMAHGRAFLPPAMIGRGVTLLNLFGIGAAGLVQMATGPIHARAAGTVQGFSDIFLFLALLVALGLLAYLPARDRRD